MTVVEAVVVSLALMITTSPSKRKEKNTVSLSNDFVESLLPGIATGPKTSSRREENWIKYLRLSIAVIRLAEYDYLNRKKNGNWQSAKRFLFGRDTLFGVVCKLMKIDPKMARMKLIATRKAGTIGDPIFESISNEYLDTDTLNLNPTAADIQKIIGDKK